VAGVGVGAAEHDVDAPTARGAHGRGRGRRKPADGLIRPRDVRAQRRDAKSLERAQELAKSECDGHLTRTDDLDGRRDLGEQARIAGAIPASTVGARHYGDVPTELWEVLDELEDSWHARSPQRGEKVVNDEDALATGHRKESARGAGAEDSRPTYR
jgi:hypothetical protein